MNEVTVGILTPHAAPGPEVELPALSHGRVRTVVVRAGSPRDLGASTNPAALEEAAATFRSSEVDAVAHASTTTGYLIGASKEAWLVAELERLCGVPAFASCGAAVAALRAGGAARVQLVHPPWFAHALDDQGVAYFRAQGFHVVATRAEELPDDPALVEPEQIVEWVEQHLRDDLDGIYLAGNGFRTAATLNELQRRTGKVIVSANQALLQAVLSSTH
jgi:maleate isomerase